MAEFQAVMRQAKRMCSLYDINCTGCIFHGNDTYCPFKEIPHNWEDESFESVEAKVMQWAEEHSEPVYPSWNEAWRQLFPNAHNEKAPCPCFFLDTERVEQFCYEHDCIECKERPIFADIAEKLGIKPIGGEGE